MAKSFATKLMRFGEACRYKGRSHEPISATGDGMSFHTGTVIGVDQSTDQHILHGEDGVKFARTVIRMPAANMFDKAEMSKIASIPWDIHRPRKTEVVFKEEQEDLLKDDNLAMARAVHTKPDDLIKSGLTRGCPRFGHQIAYGLARTARPHSAKYRASIMEELAKTSEGRVRFAAVSERLDRNAAEMGQRYRADAPQGEMGDGATSARQSRSSRATGGIYLFRGCPARAGVYR